MKTRFILIGFILIFGAAVFYDMGLKPKIYHEEKNDLASVIDARNWKDLPPIELTTVEGEPLNLNDLKGKVILLNFWATWCPTCIEDFPKMIKLIDSYNGKIILVALSNDEQKEDIGQFLKKYEAKNNEALMSPHLYICWDENKEITTKVFDTVRFPETIIISKDSKMVRKVVGDIDWSGSEMRAYMDSLLERGI